MTTKKYLSILAIALCLQVTVSSSSLEAKDTNPSPMQRLKNTVSKTYAAAKKYVIAHKKMFIGAGLIATPGLCWIAFKACTSARIPVADINQFNQAYDARPQHQGAINGLCSVCYEREALPVLSCGHGNTCVDCLNGHINQGIQAKRGHQLTCPQVGCRHTLTRSDINAITPNPQRRQTCYTLARNQWILRQGAQARFCPTPDCEEAFLNNGVAAPKTCDACHHIYCANCLVNHAAGVPCQKNASNQWKSGHAKQCPNCTSPIEKNGGCNHMTCNQCRTSFVGPVSGHMAVTDAVLADAANAF